MRPLRLACVFLSCTLCHPASAADGAWHAGAGVALKHMRFDEFGRQGSRLVREQGLLPGVLLSAGYTAAGWDLTMTGGIYAGEVDYDGQTQSGQPFGTDTDETFYELDALARYRLSHRPAQALSLYLVASADTRLWRRRIEGTSTVSGIDEDWRWQRLGAGIACDYRTATAGRFAVQARMLRTLQPQVEVRFHTGLDDAVLDLQQRYGWRLDASWSGKVAPLTELTLAGFLEHREFGRSADEILSTDGVAAGILYQPETETWEAGITAQLVRHW
ncbi:MAG: hypothetical protein J5I92_03620 [Thiogranum sp.]|nr:hypothetical protein [Thiogranum sp.]